MAERETTVQSAVKCGQVWKDNDPRGGPTFIVVNIVGAYAYVTNLRGGNYRKIRLDRFRPGKRGYSLVSGQDTEAAEDAT